LIICYDLSRASNSTPIKKSGVYTVSAYYYIEKSGLSKSAPFIFDLLALNNYAYFLSGSSKNAGGRVVVNKNDFL